MFSEIKVNFAEIYQDKQTDGQTRVIAMEPSIVDNFKAISSLWFWHQFLKDYDNIWFYIWSQLVCKDADFLKYFCNVSIWYNYIGRDIFTLLYIPKPGLKIRYENIFSFQILEKVTSQFSFSYFSRC